MDLGDPEAALEDPASFVLPERGDRVYAALSAVAAAVAANPTPERWVAGWKVLARAGETTADVAAMAARVLARCRPDGSEAAGMLRDRGCRVVPFSLPDVPEALAIFYALFGADGGAEWRKQLDGGAADPPRDTSARGFRPRPNQREAASPPTSRDRDPASVELNRAA